MNHFYVYMHRRPDDNLPFYIGKGMGKRAWHHYKRNRFWRNVVKKHGGFSVEMIIENLDVRTALDIETICIDYGKSQGWPLTNLTAGGDGAGIGNKNKLGKKESKESRRKKSLAHTGIKRPEHSARMMGKNNPIYGKGHSSEIRKKISERTKLAMAKLRGEE